MMPRAVFAMPKERNKSLTPIFASGRGSRLSKTTDQLTKKRAPKSPSCHERTGKSSISGKLWIGLHATFAQIGTFVLFFFRDTQSHH